MIFRRLTLFSALAILISCAPPRPRAPAIGEAFAGPASLNLRQDLAPQSAVTANARHGDRLEVLEYRRRFVKVRTPEGKEGWTDVRQLLTTEQMAELRQMAQRSERLPSQGLASAFEALNMHSEPSRFSPSFGQIPENGKVEVVGHKLTPRLQPPRESPAVRPQKTRPPRRRSREKSASSRVPPPPAPPGPKPPENWLGLSRPSLQTAPPAAPRPAEKPSAPVRMDDWSLVRAKDGKVGWVLTRMLNMGIPDEVAQYAEGHRITSYFALGQVRDGDLLKNNWLWTTIVKGLEPYEFDSFRVFVWSRNHHRYETAYIDRNLVGRYPVEVDASLPAPRFSLLVEDSAGQLYRKTYVLDGNRVRFLERAPYQPASANPEAPKAIAGGPAAAPSAKEEPWYARILRKWFR